MKALFTLFISWLLVLVLTVSFVSAATIHGTVYDFSLNKINKAIVEINTQPQQKEITNNADYEFTVGKGNYTIVARTINDELIAIENITITEEGNYTIDLIGFTDLEEELLIANGTEPTNETLESESNSNTTSIIFWIILLLLIIGLGFYKLRNRSKEETTDESDLADKVLEFIKKQEGRTTQKELRKQFPFSEAKISLVLTELESKNKIEKIKKGRSNVIILKR